MSFEPHYPTYILETGNFSGQICMPNCCKAKPFRYLPYQRHYETRLKSLSASKTMKRQK